MKLNTLARAAAMTMFSLLAGLAHADAVLSYSLVGTIKSCSPVCALFAETGAPVEIAFDGPASPGEIAADAIANVKITVNGPPAKAFVFGDKGQVRSSSLGVNENQQLSSGEILLSAFSKAGFELIANIDIDDDSWNIVIISPGTTVAYEFASGPLQKKTVANNQ